MSKLEKIIGQQCEYPGTVLHQLRDIHTELAHGLQKQLESINEATEALGESVDLRDSCLRVEMTLIPGFADPSAKMRQYRMMLASKTMLSTLYMLREELFDEEIYALVKDAIDKAINEAETGEKITC